MSVLEPQLYNIEAEEAVIGAVLIHQDLFTSLGIVSRHFSLHKLRFVWQAFDKLNRRQEAIDIVTVSNELERMGKFEEIGGVFYLSGLSRYSPSFLNTESYAEIIRDFAKRRQWRDLASKVAKCAYNQDISLELEASGIIDGLLSAVESEGAAVHISKYTEQVLEEAMARRLAPKDIWGIPTGFKDFDDITGGLQPSESLYISGEPGVGKSIMAAQMGFQMAQNGHPGVIYSLEMPGSQVVRRRVSAQAKIPTRNIKTGNIDDNEFASMLGVIEDYENLPLYMSDSVQWTTASLRADIAKLRVQHGVEWFVLDYAYLLQDGRGMSENDRTGIVSARMKGICRSMNMAGIVIHSMNKAGIGAAVPGMTSVRGSGQQVYDTDLLLFLVKGETENSVMCIFGKGRELENQKQAFELIRLPGYPALGDASPVHGGNDRERQAEYPMDY